MPKPMSNPFTYQGYEIEIRTFQGWLGAQPMRFTRPDGTYRLYCEHWYESAGEAFEFLKGEIDADILDINTIN